MPPPLYQIVDFAANYQHYRSEKIDNCSWFKQPTDFDIQWANLMSQGMHGAAAYGIFQSLLKLCARQRKPRLGFLTHDGRRDGHRYTIAELAMVTYQTEELVEQAFKFLLSPMVNWLVIVDTTVTPSAPHGDTTVTPSAPHGDTTVTPSAPHGDTTVTPSAQNQLPHSLTKDSTQNQSLVSPQCPHGDTLVVPIYRREDIVQKNKEDVHPHLRVDPHRGAATPAGGDMSLEDLTKWLNSFFPLREKRHWSFEETHLLSELLPIAKPDRALLSWAYKLPRDKDGWAVMNNRQLSKPKQSLLALLREFGSELDKWRGVRRNLNGSHAKPDVPLPPEWIAACVEIFGPEYIPPPCIRLLPMSVELDIKRHLEGKKHASATA